MFSQRREPFTYTPIPGISTSTSSAKLPVSASMTTRGFCQKEYGIRLVRSIRNAPRPTPMSCFFTSSSASP